MGLILHHSQISVYHGLINKSYNLIERFIHSVVRNVVYGARLTQKRLVRSHGSLLV